MLHGRQHREHCGYVADASVDCPKFGILHHVLENGPARQA